MDKQKTKSKILNANLKSWDFKPGHMYYIDIKKEGWLIGIYEGIKDMWLQLRFNLLASHQFIHLRFKLPWADVTRDDVTRDDKPEYIDLDQNFIYLQIKELEVDDLLLFIHGKTYPLMSQVLRGEVKIPAEPKS